MLKAITETPKEVTDYAYTRIVFDVSTGMDRSREELTVQDDGDFLGGIGRSFKIVADQKVTDPFAPDSPLVINTGCLTGTAYMTGLRAYFTAYSPLKRTIDGMPMAAWSAMSGGFGRKLVSAGVGDLVLTGAADSPQILVIKEGSEGPTVTLEPAPEEIIGKRTPEKMRWLNAKFNDVENRSFPAHFAVIGPAGEHWETVWYACIIGSTQEQLMSGEDKYRFAGRLGMGAVLGSKNILAIVVSSENDSFKKGDERLKAINKEIGRGNQSRGFRHPDNRDGLGGTGKNTKILDDMGVMPYKNFAPTGETLTESVHLETMRESDEFILIDKGCFGCQIACHQDFYDVPPEGKDPDSRKARRNHGPYLGRYEYETMELSGPNLGITDPRQNLALARLDDDLGFDTISVNVVLSYAMDANERNGKSMGGGVTFGNFEKAMQLKEDIAYGRETLLGKGVKAASETLGGKEFAMHSKGVEHSAYLGQTNPGYPFAVAGGHMSMLTFLLYVMDPDCKPESADYWVNKITDSGWSMVAKDLHGACLFAASPPDQIAEGISSIFGVPFTAERLLDATYRCHVLGFALERRQGTTLADYQMADETFVGEKKGDLPGVHFLTRELFDEIRGRVYEHLNGEAEKMGFGKYVA